MGDEDAQIASVLHRETIAVLVGDHTFERGEQCYAAGRVLEVAAARGELRGTIRPQDSGRPPYKVRIWVRADGLAYQCTCPIGAERQFCKHGVAVALAHLDRRR
ncbi:MAG TPA: SWIM zinc finger family protein [Kofleriaceae bacterium]